MILELKKNELILSRGLKGKSILVHLMEDSIVLKGTLSSLNVRNVKPNIKLCFPLSQDQLMTHPDLNILAGMKYFLFLQLRGEVLLLLRFDLRLKEKTQVRTCIFDCRLLSYHNYVELILSWNRIALSTILGWSDQKRITDPPPRMTIHLAGREV